MPTGDHMKGKTVAHLGQQGIGDGRGAGQGGPSLGPGMAKAKDHAGAHFGPLMAVFRLRRRPAQFAGDGGRFGIEHQQNFVGRRNDELGRNERGFQAGKIAVQGADKHRFDRIPIGEQRDRREPSPPDGRFW